MASDPNIFGKAQQDILAETGIALLQIKNNRRLTLEDMGRILGKTDDMVAKYIAGEAEMGFVAFRRARTAWPELDEKLDGGGK
jgi:cyanate lyase